MNLLTRRFIYFHLDTRNFAESGPGSGPQSRQPTRSRAECRSIVRRFYGTKPGIGTTETKVSSCPQLGAAASGTGGEHQHGRKQAVDPWRRADGGREEQSLGSNQTDRCQQFRPDMRSHGLPVTAATPTMSAAASVSGGQNQRRYTVKPGDTLSKISREFYGDANQYTKIFNANRGVLKDPNTISPGQDLLIPD